MDVLWSHGSLLFFENSLSSALEDVLFCGEGDVMCAWPEWVRLTPQQLFIPMLLLWATFCQAFLDETTAIVHSLSMNINHS